VAFTCRLRPFYDRPDVEIPWLLYKVPYTNPCVPLTVFPTRFWDDREGYYPTGIGVVPNSYRPYFGPIPNRPLGPIVGTEDMWVNGLSYEVWQAGGYSDPVGCWPIVAKVRKLKLKQRQSFRSGGPVVQNLGQAQSLSWDQAAYLPLAQLQAIRLEIASLRLRQLQSLASSSRSPAALSQLQSLAGSSRSPAALSQLQSLAGSSRSPAALSQLQSLATLSRASLFLRQLQSLALGKPDSFPLRQFQALTFTFNELCIHQNCSVVSGNQFIVLVGGNTYIRVGYSVTGSGVQAGSVITSVINSTLVEMSKTATATISSTTLTFCS